MNPGVGNHLDSELVTGRVGTLGRLVRLIRKELSETLRDRRTIMTLVLMPLLLYPLLSISFQQFLLASALTKTEDPIAIRPAFRDEQEAKDFLHFLGTVKDLPEEIQDKLYQPKFPNVLIDANVDRLRELLFRRQIDLIVIPVEKNQVMNDAQVLEWELFYLADSYRSQKAFHQLAERLAIINTNIEFKRRADDPRLQRDQLVLWATGKALTAPRDEEDFPLGSLIPLILILMTITGAVYPAIDLTAGERERGTLEILVAAPVPRMGLLFAKYVTVVAVAVLTALINLASMTITVWVTGLDQMLFGEAGLTLVLVLQIFGLLLLFAAFFSAVLLTITSFARSFKEAQAYLIPLMLVSLAPGVAGMIPGLVLTPVLSLVPLLNIVLLGRDLFNNVANPLLTTLVVSSTVVYAVGAIALAARIFGSEDVLYNSQTGWAELFRRPLNARPVASVSSALLCLCLIFSISFFVQGITIQLLRGGPDPLETLILRNVAMVFLGVALFVGLPLLVAALRRIRFASGFLLRLPPLLTVPGALLLGLSLWPFILQLLALFEEWGFTTLSQEQREHLVGGVRQMRDYLPAGMMLFSQIVQALAEELFFRGFLFAALLRVCTGRATIIISALLFGFFHVAVGGGFGFERMIPSTLMGLVLGWVCWRAGSVLPAMLLHACHNGMLVGVSYWLGQQYPGLDLELTQVPWQWLAAGAAGAVLGFALLFLSSPPKTTSENPS